MTIKKSDWVVLRLIYDIEQPAILTCEQLMALAYLVDTYGDKVVRKAVLELHRSFK